MFRHYNLVVISRVAMQSIERKRVLEQTCHLSICLSDWLSVASRSQRGSLIVIPFCLSVCLSVIPRSTAYHDWSIATKFGRQVYTCPRTRVSLYGSPISHTFGARGKNMQNFAYFQANVTHRAIWLVCLSVRQSGWRIAKKRLIGSGCRLG